MNDGQPGPAVEAGKNKVEETSLLLLLLYFGLTATYRAHKDHVQ